MIFKKYSDKKLLIFSICIYIFLVVVLEIVAYSCSVNVFHFGDNFKAISHSDIKPSARDSAVWRGNYWGMGALSIRAEIGHIRETSERIKYNEKGFRIGGFGLKSSTSLNSNE